MSQFTAGTPRFADLSLGEIAARFPGAIAVMRDVDLDFCCGGQASLRDAAAEKGLDLEALVGAFAALDDANKASVSAASIGDPLAPSGPIKPAALISHILERYHAVHRRELPELTALARKVEAVHKGHHLAPVGLVKALEGLAAELEAHMAKEELILFPLMLQGGHDMIGHPIARMRYEHDEHGARLAQLREITHDLSLPTDACRSWQALYAGLNKLIDDLMQHIHLENNLLFPCFATANDLPALPLCGGLSAGDRS